MLITEKDMKHMKAFSPALRLALMQKIMSRAPVEERVFEGNTRSVLALWRLRVEGLKLVDLQPQETAFTTVWYRTGRTLLNRQKPNVAAMVIWELNDDEEVATFKVWHV
jgi:hypothetical protein